MPNQLDIIKAGVSPRPYLTYGSGRRRVPGTAAFETMDEQGICADYETSGSHRRSAAVFIIGSSIIRLAPPSNLPHGAIIGYHRPGSRSHPGNAGSPEAGGALKSVDILIIGGGIVGSAIAYFLARTGRAGRVAVIEPDSSYELAATPAANGGIR
jgi:hypothetical protein